MNREVKREPREWQLTTLRLIMSGSEPPRTVGLPDATRARVQRGQPPAACTISVDADQEAEVEHLSGQLRCVADHRRLARVMLGRRIGVGHAPTQRLSWLLVHWQLGQETGMNKQVGGSLVKGLTAGQELPVRLGDPFSQRTSRAARRPAV